MDEDRFVGDDLVRSAVLHKLTVIGKAAAPVSSDLRQSHPEIPWADIVGFRDIAVHAYFSVDWRLVWNATMADAPALKREIEAIAANQEYAGTRNRRQTRTAMPVAPRCTTTERH